jgi:hypothetical protein
MGEFSREILSGELIVLSDWTQELYLRRAGARRDFVATSDGNERKARGGRKVLR